MASLNTIQPGDIVEVEKHGRKGICLVGAKHSGEIDITPISKGFTWRTATSRQITGHWRQTKNGRRTGQSAA